MIVQRGKKGFTLIEMLIVLIIIAVLAAVVIPKIMGARRRAKDEATRQTLASLENAVQEFEADVGCYPLTLGALITRPGGTYNGVCMAGTATAAIAVVGADTLWMGPYFNKTVIPAVPLGLPATWSLILTAPRLGEVVIPNASPATAGDGTLYADW